MPEAPDFISSLPPQTIWNRWGSLRIGLFALGLLMVDLAAQVIVYVALGDLYLAAAGGALMVAGMAAATARAQRTGIDAEFGFGRPRLKPLLLVLLIAVASLAPTSLLATLSSRIHPPPESWLLLFNQALPRTPFAMVTAFLSVSIVVPVAEELLFRGICHRLCRRHWGVIPSAAVSALLFALIHGEPWFLFGLFGLGLVLAWVYETTGSTTLCAAFHALHNTVSMTMLITQGDIELESAFEMPDWPWVAVSLLVMAWAMHRLRASR